MLRIETEYYRLQLYYCNFLETDTRDIAFAIWRTYSATSLISLNIEPSYLVFRVQLTRPFSIFIESPSHPLPRPNHP